MYISNEILNLLNVFFKFFKIYFFSRDPLYFMKKIIEIIDCCKFTLLPMKSVPIQNCTFEPCL